MQCSVMCYEQYFNFDSIPSPGASFRYDEHGKDALQEGQMLDPTVVFGMVFGSDAFEEYIGQLQLAMLAGISTENVSQEQVKQKLQAMQLVGPMPNLPSLL